MNTPIQISFPHDAVKLSMNMLNRPIEQVYKIPFAKPLLLEGNNFELFSQSFNGGDYWIELLSFSFKKEVLINFNLPGSLIAFIVFLNCNIPEIIFSGTTIPFLSGTYIASYIAAGDYSLTLQQGVTNILYLVPPYSYLETMALEHPQVAQILDRVKINASRELLLDSFYYPLAILRIIKSMERCTKKGAALDLVLRSYILKLLSFYNQQLKDKESTQSFQTKQEIVIAIRNYILENISNANLGRMKELVRHFPITSKTLTREFKKVFKKTVPEFIRDERLSLAHHLLLNQQASVQEAALQTGYEYLSHFSREFKKKYGYYPATIKKKKESQG